MIAARSGGSIGSAIGYEVILTILLAHAGTVAGRGRYIAAFSRTVLPNFFARSGIVVDKGGVTWS